MCAGGATNHFDATYVLRARLDDTAPCQMRRYQAPASGRSAAFR
jgi:hypothetical protein